MNRFKKLAAPVAGIALVAAGLASAAATDPIPNPLPNAVAGNVIKASDINDLATAVGILDERTMPFKDERVIVGDNGELTTTGTIESLKGLKGASLTLSEHWTTSLNMSNKLSGNHRIIVSEQSNPDVEPGAFIIQVGSEYSTGSDQDFAIQTMYGGTNTTKLVLKKTSGNLGIGIVNPQMKIDVNGGIRIKSVSTNCNSNIQGTIQFDGVNFQGCNGTSWVQLNN